MPTRSFNWPHRVACLLVAVTAVLLTFGAMVTTYEAAMAVPDWPGTYGHNMLLFPMREWLLGPWDLFLEHGHRLLGALVGVITLVLAGLVWWRGAAPVVGGLAAAALLLVIMQGALGGARVLLDDKTVAKVHACTGPLFFAVTVAIAVLTREVPSRASLGGGGSTGVGGTGWMSMGLVVAIYLQLVAGAQLRHLDPATTPESFQGIVALHVLGAVAVLLLAVASAMTARGGRGWAFAVLACVLCQWALGLGTWAVSWGLPTGLLPEAWQPGVPLRARAGWGAAVVTGHVLLGMLLLGLSVVSAIRTGALDRLASWGCTVGASRSRRFA